MKINKDFPFCEDGSMKYLKVTQKDYCCVGACLEMILKRHGITDYDQERIAYELGLIVPPHLASNFRYARTGKKPSAGYGTQIQEPQYSIGHFFKKHNLHFAQKYYYITSIKEAEKFLNRNNEQDILIIAHCGTLYGSPDADWGHAVLLDHINGDQVTIQENSSKKDREIIALSQLLCAIETHGQKNGAGFYLIKKI